MKAALFDVDGVLYDSEEALYELYKTVLSKHGLSVPEREEIIKWNGNRAPEWLKRLGVEPEEQLVSEIRDRYANEFFPKYAELNEDAIQTVKALRAAGVKTAVATNQTKGEAKKTLREVAESFDFVSTPEDCRPKPAPDILVKALEELGVSAEESVFVGDTELDVKAGRAAGVKTLIVARAYNEGLPNRVHSLSYLTSE